MEKILGLDLGTNSIGWAIRDTSATENQIIDKGVLTFEKGVGEGKSGEFPLVQKRTESRHKRRNYQAEKYRKWQLLDCLIENKMCPLSFDELDEWKHYKKGIGRKYPQSQKFIQWLRFDFNGDGKPDFEQIGSDKWESYYIFRVIAVSEKEEHKKILSTNPEILGRIFYQLVQRRGFKGRDEEEAQTMLKGSKDGSTKGRNDIAIYLEKYKTLGSALYFLEKEKKEKIRKRYNLRADYETELKIICSIHSISDDIYKKLWKAIVWQRPLRSQKGLVGICTFERNKSRCPVSHPLYEEYRTWNFLNNLKIKPPDGINKTEYLKGKIYPLFYNASTDFKLSTILKQLKKDGAVIEANFKDDTKLISCKLLNSLEKLLGPSWKEKHGWNESLNNQNKNCNYSFEDIWHILFTFDSSEKLKEFALNKLNLSDDNAEKFSKIKLQQGYTTLSLSALKKILPYLYKGFIYSEAVYLANLPKVFGAKLTDQPLIDNFESLYRELKKEHDNEKLLNSCINNLIRNELVSEHRYKIEDDRDLDDYEMNLIEKELTNVFGIKTWIEICEDAKFTAKTYVKSRFKEFLRKSFQGKKEDLFAPTPNLHERIKVHLKDAYAIDDKHLSYLWHPSDQETYPNAKEKKLENGGTLKILGDPQPISRGFKNPMALKTLHTLKKLLNYLLETDKIDEDTRLVIEIARELNDSNKRKAIEKWQRDREKDNEDYKKIINEINIECQTNYNKEDKTLLDKVRLWKEQNMQCLYTGKIINICDLFNGTKYDFEHTIPASMSFDNELKNLTIADTKYNREIKKKKIPYDCPNYESEYLHDGLLYPAILSSIQTIFGEMRIEEKGSKDKKIIVHKFEKIEHLENLYDDWKRKSSDTKEIKDAIIQRRHLIKFELDYWRKKLDTFICKEYKTSWRNSQLRDTQLITKYALPYLKTAFKKVEVQKGIVTAAFREIYQISSKIEKKNRNTHAHHAIDAAVLTLIPPSSLRDKILFSYNQEKDNNSKITYHEIPKGWKNFNAAAIISIGDDVLINFQPQHRVLTATYKKVRKRGRQQFVRYKDSNGKWHYKLDSNGNRISLIAKGDSIRGQLHKESFFGAIQKNGELILVERYPISTFTSINDCRNIVDDAVRQIVKDVIEKRINEGMNFDKAKLDPIPFPNGKAVIRKVRCRVAAGRGYLTPEKALEIQKHDFLSKHDYKHYTYAQNEENTLCLYYQSQTEKGTKRGFKIVGLFELAQLKLSNFNEIKNDNAYNSIEVGKGKNKEIISLANILKVGTKVIFYKDDLEELKDLAKYDLLKRVFRIYKFNEMGTPNLFLQNHLEARKNELLDDGDTSFDPSKHQYRLKIKADKFMCAIESKDFDIKLDGEIKWL